MYICVCVCVCAEVLGQVFGLRVGFCDFQLRGREVSNRFEQVFARDLCPIARIPGERALRVARTAWLHVVGDCGWDCAGQVL